MSFTFEDGVILKDDESSTNNVSNNYHNVISKAPTNSESTLYLLDDTYYIVFYSEELEEYAFFTYTDPAGPGVGNFIDMQGIDTSTITGSLLVQDGSGFLTDDRIARSIDLGKMNAIPEAYRNQRGFDPFEIMNINAEKFTQKWGWAFDPEYDEVLDLVFQAALNGTQIDRDAIQQALPPGKEINFKLIDYTNARITGPSALATWEANQKEELDTVLEAYSSTFEFDNAAVYNNLLTLWTEGNIENSTLLNKVIEKMFTDVEMSETFEQYYDEIKVDIYGNISPAALEMTSNLSAVSDEIDRYIGGSRAKALKGDRKQMAKWQNLWATSDGQDKVFDELQLIWDSNAPDNLKGSNAYNQFLYVNDALQKTQGRQTDITNSMVDNYLYLDYGEMLRVGREQGIKEGIDYTENLLTSALNQGVGEVRYEDPF